MKKILSVIATLSLFLTITLTSNAAEPFSDIKGHWAESTIVQWQDNGTVSGYPDGTFKPDNPVTRAELAKIHNGIRFI